jgi:FkbM family methyltransferase
MSKFLPLVRWTKRLFKSCGLDIGRYSPASHPEAKWLRQMKDRGINVVLDVGANTGQYASYLRELGYKGLICSFEPLGTAFGELERAASRDASWKAFNYALGSQEGEVEMRVAESSPSSSLLEATDDLLSIHPAAGTLKSEAVVVKPLDSLFRELCPESAKVLLKIDTQGYEMEVLLGSQKSLPAIEMIQVEMSFHPLYKGQPLFDELYSWICGQGFHLSCLYDDWWDPKTGDLMQVDGVFHRPR